MSRDLYVENSQYQVIFSAIFVQTTRVLSLLFLIPAISLSNVEMSYDDDTELEFYWSPATGNVSYYNVYLFVYASPDTSEPSSEDNFKLVDDTSKTHGSDAPTQDKLYTLDGVIVEYGKGYQIKVAAVDASSDAIKIVGPRSEPSNIVWFRKPWDVNMDGAVDLLDVEIIGSNMGKIPTPELDINRDSAINVLDLVLVGLHFGERYGQSGEILVPATPLSTETLALFNMPYYAFQNYPNPCNPGTWIPFMLASGGEVTVTIYNTTGQLIRRLELGYRDSGVYVSKGRAAYWDGSNEFGEEVVSGVYFYHLKSGNFSAIRKISVTR
jgi:hypothetical protein